MLHRPCFKGLRFCISSLGTKDFLVHKSVFYIFHVNFTHNFTDVSGFMCKILSTRIHLFLLRGFFLLGCVHTTKIGSSPIQSSQTLEPRGVYTDQVESNQIRASPGGYSLNSAYAKNATAIENFNMLVFTRLCEEGDGKCGCI
jgi:hypothetical protein